MDSALEHRIALLPRASQHRIACDPMHFQITPLTGVDAAHGLDPIDTQLAD